MPVVQQHSGVVLQPSSRPETVRRENVGGRVILRVGERCRQRRGEVVPLAGRQLDARVVGAIIRDQPVAARAGPLVADPGEELAPLPRLHIDGPDIVIRTAEHRAERIGFGDVLHGEIPAVEQGCVPHEIRAESDDPVRVQVPGRQQRSARVPALRRLLLREDADVAGVPDLKAGKVRLLFVGFTRGIGIGVAGRGAAFAGGLGFACSGLSAFSRTGIVHGVVFSWPQPDRDHGALVGPLRRLVHNFQSVRDADRPLTQYHHLHAPVEAAPREHVVGGTFLGGVRPRAQGGQISRIVPPPEAPVPGSRGIRRRQCARNGIVDLNPVAEVGPGRDSHGEQRPGGIPGHLAHITEAGFHIRGKREHPDIGPLARRLLGCVPPQRQEPTRGIEAPLRDRLELSRPS